MVNEFPAVSNSCLADGLDQALQEDLHGFFDTLSLATLAVRYHLMTYLQFISPGTDPAILTAIGLIPGLLIAFLTCWKAIRKFLSKKTKQTKKQLIRCFRWCNHLLSHIVTRKAAPTKQEMI